MKINLSLTTKGSFENAIKQLEDYKISLREKSEKFVSLLIETGIETAKVNSGEYAGMIAFTKELSPDETGCSGMLIAADKTKIIREWRYKGGTKTAEVSPLLMAEFGSGWLAKVLDDVDGVGQGTFPGQTHAFDPHGWWWTTPDGEHHHSIGEAPTYPMHSAMLAMLFEVDRIGKEVFGDGK